MDEGEYRTIITAMQKELDAKDVAIAKLEEAWTKACLHLARANQRIAELEGEVQSMNDLVDVSDEHCADLRAQLAAVVPVLERIETEALMLWPNEFPDYPAYQDTILREARDLLAKLKVCSKETP